MSRALRHAPPLANRGLITRPRLLAPVRGRFRRPLTVVVAAAGFGKTTLLAQAVRENALSPEGTDCWLTCQRDDAALSLLAAGTFAAVGLTQPVPEDPDQAAVLVAEAIWKAAPGHVALIFDDAHRVPADSPGWQFLDRLIAELPGNGHVVLASRPPLPLAVTRLVATGDAVVLGEEELRFRTDELTSFADSRGVPPELLTDVGGWPALAELTATAGPHAVTGYVWEELLSRLTPERRHALALLVAVGGVDDEIAATLLGPGVVLDRLLDGVPLVVRARSGWWSLHGLWAAALQHHLDAEEVAEARRSAAAILRRRRQYLDAMDLLLDAEAWDDIRDLIVCVCEVCTPLVGTDVLQAWLQELPLEVQRTPEGLLLAAMVVEPASPDTAEKMLEEAFAAAPPAAQVRYAALNALIQLAFWRGDRRQMKVLVARLNELAAHGHPAAPGWIALIQALLARPADRVRAELAVPSLASGAALNPVQDWLYAHLVLLKLGDPASAEPLARRSLAHNVSNMAAVSRCELIETFRLRGRLDEAERLLPDLLGDMVPAKVLTSPEVTTYAVVLLCILGRDDEAADVLHLWRPTVAASPVAWAPVAGALAEAFAAVSAGAEEAAAGALRAVAHLGTVRTQVAVMVHPAALPLLYVLVPEARPCWDDEPAPGCFGETHRLARALVGVRERGSLAEVRELPPNAARVAWAQLPQPWAAELAVALVAAGRDEARELLAEGGQRARGVLKAQSRSAVPAVADAARRLLRELPAVPAHRLRLRVLGPLELLRDGEQVTAPDLRRERVRQLLGYLLVHERPTRTAVAAALWPDLDEAAAARNLRVTLTYLQNLLEPDRDEQDPPYFLRSSGPVLHLAVDGAVADGALELDALEFERLLEEAAALEAQGALSAALTAYQRAAALWDGDYLVDVPDDEWLQWERDRLRDRFVRAAVRAGHLLLARGDCAAARRLAERALRAEQWSEPAYQLLIAVHLALGDRAGASRSLHRCQQMLRDLGVAPQQRTRFLAGQLRADR